MTVIPPKVLVIDDDRTMLAFVTMVLRKEGYALYQAASGEDAIELIETLSPALIVCDWMMPGMTGLEVCHYIKSHPKLASTFFILLTAREEVADRIQGLDMGADEFVSKPVNASELR
ncbi:MAG: response regulator, partial [Prochlorothrix sp.]